METFTETDQFRRRDEIESHLPRPRKKYLGNSQHGLEQDLLTTFECEFQFQLGPFGCDIRSDDGSCAKLFQYLA